MKRRPFAVGPLVAGISLVGLLATACGPSTNDTSSTTNNTSSTANTAAGQNTGSKSAKNQSNTTGSNQSASGTTNGNSSNGTVASGANGSGNNSGGSQSAAAYAGWPKPGSWLAISVKKIAQLPQGILGNALAMGPNGHPVSVGGYTGQVSITNVYQLTPTVSTIANLPVRTHDAAVGFVGSTLYVFGGGQAASYNTVVAIQNGSAKTVANLSQPLSDAVSAPLVVDGKTGLALVGGYNGSVYRTDASYMTLSSSGARVWKQLFTIPTPVRYAGVTSNGNTLYFAGGMTQTSLSNGVYAWTAGASGAGQSGGSGAAGASGTGATGTAGQLKKVGTLPKGLQKAALYVAGPYLIVIGGESTSGQPQNTILELDTRTGKTKVVGKFPTSIADMGYTQSETVGYLAGGVTTSSDSSATNAVYQISWQK